MTCPKCKTGFLYPDRDDGALPNTWYCLNCAWRGRHVEEPQAPTIAIPVTGTRRGSRDDRPRKLPERRTRVLSPEGRARLVDAMRDWHRKRGHKMALTEREILMRLKNGHIHLEQTPDGVLFVVTEINTSLATGSRTASILVTREELDALLKPLREPAAPAAAV